MLHLSEDVAEEGIEESTSTDTQLAELDLSDAEVIELLKITEDLLAGQMTKIEKKSEGGLLDEGGEKDPVSGNKVPAGSTKKEVRDDIPAMLSEGEFVFPADVTRYYGLDTLMKMRQKAKQGLKVMEAMGQMGNSEEATLPDDIPFDMDDLELAEGGVVQAQQGIYVPPDINTPTTGQPPSYGTAPVLSPLNQPVTGTSVPDVPPEMLQLGPLRRFAMLRNCSTHP